MKEKGGKVDRENWYKMDPRKYTSTLVIPATKGGSLRKAVEQALNTCPSPVGVNIKVVEDTGRTAREGLSLSDPFPRERCSRYMCPLEGPKGCATKCYSANCNYQYTCGRCEEKVVVGLQHGRTHGEEPGEIEGETELVNMVPQYRGKSSRSLYTRHMGHLTDYARQKTKGFMWSHTRECTNFRAKLCYISLIYILLLLYNPFLCVIFDSAVLYFTLDVLYLTLL